MLVARSGEMTEILHIKDITCPVCFLRFNADYCGNSMKDVYLFHK
jgi:hypothetical protein